ncbi:hypothetical protein [Streptomyces sp. NPDC001889]
MDAWHKLAVAGLSIWPDDGYTPAVHPSLTVPRHDEAWLLDIHQTRLPVPGITDAWESHAHRTRRVRLTPVTHPLPANLNEDTARAHVDQAQADEKSGTRTGTTDVRHPRKRRT